MSPKAHFSFSDDCSKISRPRGPILRVNQVAIPSAGTGGTSAAISGEGPKEALTACHGVANCKDRIRVLMGEVAIDRDDVRSGPSGMVVGVEKYRRLRHLLQSHSG
jgi:hypothetical protein